MNMAVAFNPTMANGLQNPMAGLSSVGSVDPRLLGLSASGAQMPAIGYGVGGAGIAPQGNMWDRFSNWMGSSNNMQTLGTIAQGLGALGGLYMGNRQLGLAREQLGLQREAFNANLNNSIQSYNTRLEDRIRGRTSNPNEADIQAYLARHRLSR